MRKIAKVLLFIVAGLVVVVALLALYVRKALPNVGKPADLRVQITPARVAHGEYLAKSVAGCMICHSNRDTNFYGSPVKDNTLGMGGELFGRREGFPVFIYLATLPPFHFAQ